MLTGNDEGVCGRPPGTIRLDNHWAHRAKENAIFVGMQTARDPDVDVVVMDVLGNRSGSGHVVRN